ncbi:MULTISPECIES: pilus assembly PilX family protein [Pseudomonadaceae]|jgi:type IV pilus assembly protein PilX|uniref:pilus assembly PilX family protein n=1 Tax=Pseudomonadaceae TaxID=135621 RepID=UPI0009E2E414|nr:MULTISPECIES: PilX N-terminal domain-containing pilus assembly protein [Pseudomonas]MBO2929638.1 hypothetical protein [Pseudomonas otitidis]
MSNQLKDVGLQRGAALFISLILLLVVTLLAVASIKGVALDERLVGNLRELQIVSQAAESALREGEYRLTVTPSPPSTATVCDASVSLCVLKKPILSLHAQDWSWWDNDANSKSYKGSAGVKNLIFGLQTQPRWFAVFIGFDPQNSQGTVEVTDIDERRRGVGPYYYEVNAASRGSSQRVMTVIQSKLVQRF